MNLILPGSPRRLRIYAIFAEPARGVCGETEGRAVSVDRFEVNREQISTLNHAIGEYREKPFYTISESL